MGKREKLEQQAQEIKDLAGTRVEELRQQARELRERAEHLLERAEQMRERAGGRVVSVADRAATTAEELGEELQERAEAKVAGNGHEDNGTSRSKKGLIALFLAGLAGAVMFLKRKRERELDEALWEEPRSL